MGTLEILIRLGALLFLASFVFRIVWAIITWIIALIFFAIKEVFGKGTN